MSVLVKGEARHQVTLFTQALDEYVIEENPIRVFNAFVDILDLGELEFKTIPANTGRPASSESQS